MKAFRIVDVAPDTIIAAALVVANKNHASGSPTSADDVARALGLKRQQAGLALDMASQLKILDDGATGEYTFTGNPQLRVAPKAGLAQFFRQAAQQYPPFLLYLGYLSRGFEPEEAARHSAVAFSINLDPMRVKRILNRWAVYAGIVDAHGRLDFQPKEILDFGFLSRLQAGLQDDLRIKTFVMDELGHALWGEMYGLGLDPDAFARALSSYETSPHGSLSEVGSFVEAHLAAVGSGLGGPQANIIPLADFLAAADRKKILRTHRNIAAGVAGFRNASAHGPDPDTGKSWNISPEGALVGTLAALVLTRSVASYVDGRKTQRL